MRTPWQVLGRLHSLRRDVLLVSQVRGSALLAITVATSNVYDRRCMREGRDIVNTAEYLDYGTSTG